MLYDEQRAETRRGCTSCGCVCVCVCVCDESETDEASPPLGPCVVKKCINPHATPTPTRPIAGRMKSPVRRQLPKSTSSGRSTMASTILTRKPVVMKKRRVGKGGGGEM